MFASDFLFDNQRASDLGLIICSFNNEFETASGGEIEFNTIHTPGNDKFTFYGSQFNSVITWNFSICKNPCSNKILYFDQYEESLIVKWLLHTDGYKILQFYQEGYSDISYYVYFNIIPHQIEGKTVGFDLTATSNCGYGYTNIIKRKTIINSSMPLKINIHSDINTYILPIVKVKGEGRFSIDNYKDMDLKYSILDKKIELAITKEVIMDSENDVIIGLQNPDDFNYHFLKLIDGINIITTDSISNIELEIQYREPRRIII